MDLTERDTQLANLARELHLTRKLSPMQIRNRAGLGFLDSNDQPYIPLETIQSWLDSAPRPGPAAAPTPSQPAPALPTPVDDTSALHARMAVMPVGIPLFHLSSGGRAGGGTAADYTAAWRSLAGASAGASLGQTPTSRPVWHFRRLLLGGPTGGAVVVFVPGSPGTVAAVVASAPAPSSPAAAALARRLLEPRAARQWRRRRGWRGGCWWRRTTAASRPAGAGGRASRSGTRGSTSAPRPGSTPNQLEAERHYRKSSWSSGMLARGADWSRPRALGRGPGACVQGR
jgi:hypothetical protein